MHGGHFILGTSFGVVLNADYNYWLFFIGLSIFLAQNISTFYVSGYVYCR